MRDATRSMPFSVLDLSPVSSSLGPSESLRRSVDLARDAEECGYHRYWVGEHHNMRGLASSSPEVMMATIAARTSRIRVGSGGIMLGNHAPLKVVETMRTLEALHPGRIDLGVGRAPGADPLTALALRGSQEALNTDFVALCSQVVSFSDGFGAGVPLDEVQAAPADAPLPGLWALGGSARGAAVAAAFGVGFAFAGHLTEADPTEAVQVYRSRFRPAEHSVGCGPRPRVLLCVAAVCADTGARATELEAAVHLATAHRLGGRNLPLPTPEEAARHTWTAQECDVRRRFRHTVSSGTPLAVREEILLRAKDVEADEVMVASDVVDPGERLRSQRLIGEALSPTG